MLLVIVEILDFLFKAGAMYLTTPQGKKEWSDIERKFEEVKK